LIADENIRGMITKIRRQKKSELNETGYRHRELAPFPKLGAGLTPTQTRAKGQDLWTHGYRVNTPDSTAKGLYPNHYDPAWNDDFLVNSFFDVIQLSVRVVRIASLSSYDLS
jgi:hypothetical protein